MFTRPTGSPSVSRLLGLAVAAALSAFATAGHAQLSIDVRSDILAARANFQAQAGVLEAFTWSSAFPPGTHVPGVFNPFLNLGGYTFTAADGSTHVAVGANGLALSFAPGNWIDGPGFDGPGGTATADLALNGAESFDLVFGTPYRSVGMAISTGMGNAPSEVDLTGASFVFTALNASGGVIGSANLSLAPGAPVSAWVTLVGTAPISRLLVREVNAVSIRDQYFSDVLVTPSAVSAVPEPASMLLLALGVVSLRLRSVLRQQPVA
jgi:hypothetical protein